MQQSPLSSNKGQMFLSYVIFFEMLLVLLALVQQEGGIYNNGISNLSKYIDGRNQLIYVIILISISLLLTFSIMFYNKLGSLNKNIGVEIFLIIVPIIFISLYFALLALSLPNTSRTILFKATMYSSITVMIVLTSMIYRSIIKRIKLISTIVFGYTLTVSMYIATSNYVIMFMTVTFIPVGFWYYVQYGEIATFFSNRIVIISIRRSIAIIPLFLAISSFTFFSINLIGDPADIRTQSIRVGKKQIQKELRYRWGLTDVAGNPIPIWKRYITWINDFIHGDLGTSYRDEAEVSENITRFLWETLKMQVLALVIAFTLSVLLGILAAYYHKTFADSSFSAFALLGLSMPIFVSGILSILIFGGTGLNWFPSSKARSLSVNLDCPSDLDCSVRPGDVFQAGISTNWNNFSWWGDYFQLVWIYTKDSLMHLVLPVLTLSFAIMATFTRLTRSTMLEVMKQDYILAARANGLSEREILRKHALPNILLPLVTFLGINIGFLLAGAPITETIFTWPGLGLAFLVALTVLDVPVLMALTMIITLMILFANLLTDIAYSLLDPRITL